MDAGPLLTASLAYLLNQSAEMAYFSHQPRSSTSLMFLGGFYAIIAVAEFVGYFILTSKYILFSFYHFRNL